MPHIEVQPHPDRVRRNDVIHLARLIQLHLRIARARGERAHDNRASPTLPLQQLGNRVDFLRRERDHGRALGQLRDLDRPRIAELREPLPPLAVDMQVQPLQRRPHRIRAQQHRLMPPTRPENTIREDVTTIRVLRELYLVDGDKVRALTPIHAAHRHRLDRAGEIPRRLRPDAFLARDQRASLRALHLHHPVIDLARQQAQRQPDHPRPMRQHPLDGEVRLAGVRRTQNGPDNGCVVGGHAARS